MSTTKSGTAKTETIIGTAATKLNVALKSVIEATAKMAQLTEVSDTLTSQIADKEGKLAALDVQFAEKQRAFEVQLKLDMQDNTASVVTTYLASTGKVAVDKGTYDELQAEMKLLLADNKSEIDKAVAVATNSMKSRHESDMALKEAQFKMQEASNTAKIQSLQEQIVALTKDRDMWKASLDAEREAGIKRAQAGAIGSVNVGTNGK